MEKTESNDENKQLRDGNTEQRGDGGSHKKQGKKGREKKESKKDERYAHLKNPADLP